MERVGAVSGPCGCGGAAAAVSVERRRFRRACAVIALGTLTLSVAGCGRPTPEAGAGGIVRVGGDVIGSRGSLVLSEDVVGDVMLAGGEIEFSGTAGGDYLGAGGQQEISGRIDGSLRAAGGEIEVASEIGRNATFAGGEVNVTEGTVVDGNMYIAAGNIRIDGRVNGALRATGAEVALEGSVGEDVYVSAGQLQIGPGAVIGGDLRYRVAEDHVVIDPSAQIAGTITALPPPRSRPGPGSFRIVLLLGFLVAGIAFVLLFPNFTQRAAATMVERPGASIAWGLGWFVLAPLAVISLAITLIGIPLAVITFLIYCITLFLARVVPALGLGVLILRERVRPGRGGVVVAFLLGALVLLLAELLPLLGVVVLFAATVVGLGAVAVTLRDRRVRAPGA